MNQTLTDEIIAVPMQGETGNLWQLLFSHEGTVTMTVLPEQAAGSVLAEHFQWTERHITDFFAACGQVFRLGLRGDMDVLYARQLDVQESEIRVVASGRVSRGL